MVTRLALLGAGRIGKVHAGAIASDRRARLLAVADANEDAAKAIADASGAQVRSIDEIERASDVDAVLICAPTNTHADLIERFARAGKAVFCEKPIDLDIARVHACLAVIRETGAKVMLGFNRRFDPHFVAVRKAIDDGRIGKVEMVTITSRDPGAPPADYIKVSGGIFRDMTIHDFDMARFLLGEEIESVAASASVLVDPKIGELGDYDSASVILTTASGRQCVISNSRRASYGYDQRIEVHGSLGAVSAENQRPVSIEIASKDGYNRPPLHDFFMTRYTAAYAAEIGAFIDALDSGKAPMPSAEDGLKALALAEAALRSVKKGRTVKVAEILP
ncbi:inositol 2-dehydrogenase [Brucella melitensis]|uniref:inositol 2-dehydrogenase n=1 Tax=Brucella melitensis TaxID=29459 RepID=UPI0002CF9092|nr:inositol 2-dehydrogenase [Brucella melitensis]ARY26322.1 inositol 2-dehydrogenase [Brucella melitensis]ARY29492.1 inositol 2-dehydrogenase [Brucella melitensis]ENQ86885.1 inositol 2-dehydrogenase [Brucella melitensis F5/07-239A]ENQ93227.1 inositol 2-dehydrogenase [Brucella melitensis R3/07-2]ENT69188.1 inositol 2-dehydrogenase [Brucella melitensis F15/06-7]